MRWETLTTETTTEPVLGKEGSASAGIMTYGSQSRKEASGLRTLISTKTTIKIGAWNVRTMYQAGKSAQVAAEMRNYGIELLGLSETRWLQAGEVRL